MVSGKQLRELTRRYADRLPPPEPTVDAVAGVIRRWLRGVRACQGNELIGRGGWADGGLALTYPDPRVESMPGRELFDRFGKYHGLVERGADVLPDELAAFPEPATWRRFAAAVLERIGNGAAF